MRSYAFAIQIQITYDRLPPQKVSSISECEARSCLSDIGGLLAARRTGKFWLIGRKLVA